MAQPDDRQGPPPVPTDKQIEKMVKELDKELKLTDEQDEQVSELYFVHFEKVEAKMKSSQRPSRTDMEAPDRIGKKEESASHVENFLFVKSEYKILRINLNDIRYIEGMREYVRIHIKNQKAVMALMSMKKMEAFLPQQRFMRVHRSYIVNLEKVNAIERNRILFDPDVRIPISEQYKEAFQEYLDKNFLV